MWVEPRHHPKEKKSEEHFLVQIPTDNNFAFLKYLEFVIPRRTLLSELGC